MMFWRLASVAVVLAASSFAGAEGWKPADARLVTRWTKDVDPERALAEHPRPQWTRPEWKNLNGLWQYAIRPAGEGQPTKWDGEILVPFAVESALSGVQRAVQPDERLWYRREFESPAASGERLLLHFGAVDYKCTVWVNGKQVGEHVGGYVPFTLDITDALHEGGKANELVVAVSDPTDTGTQPRGKQVLKPHGIFYTAVTGIWQTVWLEPVPARHVKSLKVTPNLDESSVQVAVDASAPGAMRVHVLQDGKPVATAESTEGAATVKVPNGKAWSPAAPHLYDLRVELVEGDKVVDAVDSYFGLRKIEFKKDAEGVHRLWLNNGVVFQYGPLDQGWWPDGLYTAPTDEALKYDIEMTKRLGFNMARKHVKVEPARWYYWCDKLGLLVWQDMPSGDVEKTAESKQLFRQELQAMLDALHHFPSIVMWVPFNEGWGQHETEDTAAWVKQYDPTRLVNESSGWHDKGSGDVADMHNYPGPGMREPEEKRVVVLGEFGGLGMPVRGHTWQDEKNWGYVSYENKKELTDAYVDLLAAMRPLIGRGLAAAVYTQTTDVEIEVNGLLTYDRELVKMDEPRIVAAAKALYEAPPEVAVLLPTSEESPQTWKYTTTRPAEGWKGVDFNERGWREGEAGFGAGEVRDAVTRTPWTRPNIWMRRTFDVKNVAEDGQLALNILNDDEAEIYINGRLVRSLKRPIKSYQLKLLEPEAAKFLRKGRNTIAVHCKQLKGPQYIDVGLVQMAGAE